jgi:hypothetical protein
VVALILGGVVMMSVARVDRRQEGGRGARLCSRRDADGGESEKGVQCRAAAFIGLVGGRVRR